MRVVRTKLMRLAGKKYMLLFCWLLAAPKAKISDVDMNHELIHSAQARELLYVFFYIWYVIEWFVRLIQFRNRDKAYRNISFEREAYKHQENLMYLSKRTKFNFLNYL